MPMTSIDIFIVIGLTFSVIAAGLIALIVSDDGSKAPANSEPDSVSSDTPEEADWHTRGFSQPWDHF